MPDKKKTVKKKTTKQTQKQSQTSKQVVNINLETKPKRKSRSKSSSSANTNKGIKTTKQQYREYVTSTPSVVQVMPSNNELVASIQSILSRNQPNPVPVSMNPEILQRLEGQLTGLNNQLKAIVDVENEILDESKNKGKSPVKDFGKTPHASAFKPIAIKPEARTPTMEEVKQILRKKGNFKEGVSPVRGRPAAGTTPLTEEQKKARKLYSQMKQIEKQDLEAGAARYPSSSPDEARYTTRRNPKK